MISSVFSRAINEVGCSQTGPAVKNWKATRQARYLVLCFVHMHIARSISPDFEFSISTATVPPPSINRYIVFLNNRQGSYPEYRGGGGEITP